MEINFKNILAKLGVATAMLAALAGSAMAQTSSALWQDIAEKGLARPAGGRLLSGSNHRIMTLDRQGMAALLAGAPVEKVGSARAEGLEIELPMPRGGFQRFRVQESSIMEPALAVQFPDLKTYVAQGIDDPTASVRLDLTPQGFHAMVLAADDTVYVDPYSQNDPDHYVSYFKSDFSKEGATPFKCEVHNADHPITDHKVGQARASNGTTLRTYRLAMAATGEYTTFHGGMTGAMAAIVTTINRNTGIYERDLAVRFTLVSAPGAIYTNAATDPYVNTSADIDKNTGVLDGLIGSAAYDIGHVFQTGPGGVAYLGRVCNSTFKGGGVTGTSSPMGDAFDVDFVAHEIGHQFGGNHSFNGTAGSCPTRNADTAAEVGSGSTILAYAGICSVENLQRNSDDIFHSVTLDEIQAFIITGNGAGGGPTCGTQSATGNTPPALSVPATAYTIPKGTPFALTATGSDANGDSLTYAWEDRSLGAASTDAASAQTDDGTRPLFRAYRPTVSPTRLFPKLTDILGTTVATTYINGETRPNTARTMTFNVTARDNRAGGGGTNDATVAITVNAASGPFMTTNFATPASVTGGSTQTVTWNVANTTAAPVSCANVTIGFSPDGGTTYTSILTSTANNGTASVVVPNTTTTTGHFRVGCVGNIFFDYTKGALTVTPGAPPTVSTPTSASVAASSATLGGTIASDGGVAITARGVVYAATATNANPEIGGTGVTQVLSTDSTATFTSAVTGLTGATGYSFKAFATGSGTGYSAAATFTTTAPTVPGAPTIGTAVAGNASVIVAFIPPVDTGGAPINGYKATCGAQAGTGVSSPVTVSGLTNGTAVMCTVQAQNSVGLGASSAASNSVTPAPVPAVTSPTSASVTAIAATLGGNVTSDGGSSLTERGVVYSLTSANASPAIGGTGVTKSIAMGTTTGVFTSAVTGLSPAKAYSFAAYATNSGGTSYSSVGTFTTLAGDTIPRLVNIATRARVQTGDNVMIAGFIIGGSSPKKVLITARGPSLAAAPFSVPGTLADPFLTVFSGQTVIDANDDFGTRPNAGEIPSDRKPSNAKEAAILTTLSPGAYTAIVTGAGATPTGVAIVEVFEIDLPEIPLINIATRSRVETGDNVMIAGFVIQGNAARTVLVTARGPSLAAPPFNVPGTLADPYMRIYSGQTVIFQNDNWMDGANANLIPETQKPKDPKDAALLVTLAPGAYTVIVGGGAASTDSGVAIVEVFVQ